MTGGVIDIRQSGTHTEFTQRSDTALLNHRSFDIRANESVHFAQPSPGALAVNRVVGSDLPTSIAGKLTANGNVWVLNPSGVAIKGTAQVNVGGLLATTASISDEAILAGERRFSGAPRGSAVSNAGTITAGKGSVVLVAPALSNTGTITAQGSDVALGAGSGFTVDFDGDGLTRFEVSPGGGVGLSNAGTITAQGGAAYISAASADAVQNSVVSIGGRVEATRVEQRGGVVYISGGGAGVTEVSGRIDASQLRGDGGRVAIAGERIDIRPDAVIDVSGSADGGSIEIGGGVRGAPIASPVLARSGAPEGAPLPTARRTVVRRGAQITAGAGPSGDGGTVVVWAEEATGFRGAIDARGGTLAGDGGVAEVSGRGGLSFDGSVDLGAPAGRPGTLLLDPETVTIVSGAAGDAGQDAALDDRIIAGADEPANFTISAGAVANSVSAADTVIEATQTITQQAAITLSGNNALTLRAGSGDVTLGAAVTGPGNSLTIEAGGDVALNELTLAALEVTAGQAITQAAGAAIDVSGEASLAAEGGVTLGTLMAGALEVSAGEAAAQIAGSAIDVSGEAQFILGGDLLLGELTAASLNVAAGDDIAQRSGTAIEVAGQADLAAGGDIVLTAPGNDLATVDFDADGVSVTDRNSIQLGEIDAETLTVAAGGAITDTPGKAITAAGATNFSAAGGGLFFDIALDGNDADPDDRPHNLLGPFAASGEDVAVANAVGILLGDVTTHAADGLAGNGNDGDLTVLAGGSISQAAGKSVTAPGDARFEAVGGSITLAQATNDLADEGGGHAVSLLAPGAVAIVDSGSLALGASSGSDLQAVATDLSITGPIEFDSGVTLTNSAGDLARIGVAVPDTDGSSFDLSDADIAQIRAKRVVIATGAGGIEVQGVNLDAESLTLDAPAGPVSFTTASSSVAGDLSVTAASMAQDANGAIAVNGPTDLVAAGAIALGGAANDFDADAPGPDAVDPVDGTGTAVALADLDAIALGEISAESLEVHAGGSIIDTPGKSVEVDGATALTALGVGDDFDIQLDNAGAADGHLLHGVISAAGEDIAIANGATSTRLGTIATGLVPRASADATIAQGNDGDLAVIAASGPIIDTAGQPIAVRGTTELQAGREGRWYDVALDDPGLHDFSEASPFNAAAEDISIADADGILLGRVAVHSADGAGDPTLNDPLNDGTLLVIAGGPVTDTPGSPITVPGSTALTALSGSNFFDIVLDGATGDPSAGIDLPHDFGGPVSARGEDVVLHDRTGIVLGRIDANESGRNDPTLAWYDNDGNGSATPADRAAAGDLTVRAGAGITDTGAIIDVEGHTRLEAGAGDIRLDGIDGDATDRPHDFDSDAIGDAVDEVDAIGRTVALVDADAIALGDVRASGDLSVAAGGSVTDTAGEAVIVGGRTTIAAIDRRTSDPAGDNYFDIALDNRGLHELGTADVTGEGVILVDRRDLTIAGVVSRSDGAPDGTIPDDGIFLQVGQGGFAFAVGPDSTPIDAVRDIVLSAPNGSFDSDPDTSVVSGALPDGLTFRSPSGNILLDFRDGFVVADIEGTIPFTLDAPNGISRIRIGADGEPEFLGIGTAEFLKAARGPGFNPLFDLSRVGDAELFRVTGDFALVARSPLTVRFQNTFGTANEGAGAVVDGTTFLGGKFEGLSVFGTFNMADSTNAALDGFRSAANIGETSFVIENENTANGCAILVPTSCQPIGSLLPALGYQDGLLLGVRFVAPSQDLDDPFTNRGDEEEWE